MYKTYVQIAYGYGDFGHDLVLDTAAELHANLLLVEHLHAVQIHGELADLGKAPHDVLERTGEDVDAAHDQHVIDAADHAALAAQVGAAAAARLAIEPHAVPGPVPDERHADATEVRHDELTLIGRLARRRVDHLADELTLVDVQAALYLALVAP